MGQEKILYPFISHKVNTFTDILFKNVVIGIIFYWEDFTFPVQSVYNI